MLFRPSALTLLALATMGTSWVACVTSSDSPPGPQAFDGGGFDAACTSCAPDGDLPRDAATDTGSLDAATPDDSAGGGDAASAKDVYVDPAAGLDTNGGTSASPFKTIGRAFTVVPAGSTVWLADGTYLAAAEGNKVLAIPDGTTLAARNAGLAVLSAIGFTANGASTGIAGVVFASGATLTAKNTAIATPTLTLTGVLFTSTSSAASTLAVGGNVHATVSQTSFSGNLPYGTLTISEAATLVMTGGTIDAKGTGSVAFGGGVVTATGTSNVTLDGVTLKNVLATGIVAGGNNAATPLKLTLRNGTTLDAVGCNGTPGACGAIVIGANANVTIDGSEVKNSPGSGLCVRASGVTSNVTVTVQNAAKFTNDVRAITSEPGSGQSFSVATFKIAGATFASNSSAAIYWEGTGSFDIGATTFSANGIGMQVWSTPSVKLRNNVFAANTTYAFFASSVSAVLPLDLGTTASAGGNTLTSATGTGLYLSLPSAPTIDAVGNTWNANAQGADAAGHYPAGTTIAGPVGTGANYVLSSVETLHL